MGVDGSELRLAKPSSVLVKAKVAARLNSEPIPGLAKRNYAQKPYWHVERARIEDTRKVPVEVIVNGYTIAQQEILADGELRDIAFEVPIQYSSWIALRILTSSHTNPVFVVVDGKPIRASKRSAEWCLAGVKNAGIKNAVSWVTTKSRTSTKPTITPRKSTGRSSRRASRTNPNTDWLAAR